MLATRFEDFYSQFKSTENAITGSHSFGTTLLQSITSEYTKIHEDVDRHLAAAIEEASKELQFLTNTLDVVRRHLQRERETFSETLEAFRLSYDLDSHYTQASLTTIDKTPSEFIQRFDALANALKATDGAFGSSELEVARSPDISNLIRCRMPRPKWSVPFDKALQATKMRHVVINHFVTFAEH
ncbi:hypothetical protein EYR36_003306 [Pleurotus pulmonarius]|nr:hypothetical protein EYR36_003306 [Pleurotus pulmonarius]